MFQREFAAEGSDSSDDDDVFWGIESVPNQSLFHSSLGKSIEEMLSSPPSKVWYLEKQVFKAKRKKCHLVRLFCFVLCCFVCLFICLFVYLFVCLLFFNL